MRLWQWKEEGGEQMKYLSKKLTRVCELILKKAHVKNTESNQKFVSGLLGFVTGSIIYMLLLIFA